MRAIELNFGAVLLLTVLCLFVGIDSDDGDSSDESDDEDYEGEEDDEDVQMRNMLVVAVAGLAVIMML